MSKQFHLTVKNKASSKSKIEELTKYHNYHQWHVTALILWDKASQLNITEQLTSHICFWNPGILTTIPYNRTIRSKHMSPSYKNGSAMAVSMFHQKVKNSWHFTGSTSDH